MSVNAMNVREVAPTGVAAKVDSVPTSLFRIVMTHGKLTMPLAPSDVCLIDCATDPDSKVDDPGNGVVGHEE